MPPLRTRPTPNVRIAPGRGQDDGTYAFLLPARLRVMTCG